MGFREIIHINGIPIRVHSTFDREIADKQGRKMAEMEVSIMLRGRMPNNQFIQLTSRDAARLDYEDGPRSVTMFTKIVNRTSVASGDGEGAMYRHDLTFRELPESWQRRSKEQESAKPVAVAPPVARKSGTSTPAPAPIEDISQVKIGTSVAQWGDAIRQLQTDTPRPRVTEEPLSQIELTAIETVLTNLRIDALLDQLDAAGVIRRAVVDERFRALVERRFMAEAIPLVGRRLRSGQHGEFAEG